MSVLADGKGMLGVNRSTSHACGVQDQQLNAPRSDFIRLRDEEGIRELIDAGYAYAQRTEAAGGFDRFFGGRAGALQAPDAAVFS